jgi:hypothetical protein
VVIIRITCLGQSSLLLEGRILAPEGVADGCNWRALTTFRSFPSAGGSTGRSQKEIEDEIKGQIIMELNSTGDADSLSLLFCMRFRNANFVVSDP